MWFETKKFIRLNEVFKKLGKIRSVRIITVQYSEWENIEASRTNKKDKSLDINFKTLCYDNLITNFLHRNPYDLRLDILSRSKKNVAPGLCLISFNLVNGEGSSVTKVRISAKHKVSTIKR